MPTVVVAYLACALIWGTTWFAIRVCIGEGGYPTYASAALRFSLAAVILIGVYVAGFGRPGPRRRREWIGLIASGVLNAVGYGLIYTAEEELTGGLAAVLFGTAPIMMAVVGSVSGVERPTTAGVVGALISLAGIAAIYLDRLEVSTAQAAGVAMVLGSVMCSTIYNVILKRRAAELNPLASNAVFLATTAVVLWVFTLAVERRPLPAVGSLAELPVAPTIALVYLGVIGSVVAFASYFYLLKRVRLMTLSTLVFIQPMIALSADALWDPAARAIAPMTWIGAAVTLAGIAVSVLGRSAVK